jgi:hypothetical protein
MFFIVMLEFFIIALCAIVIVIPELSKSNVFTNGNPQTSSGCVSTGGHTAPIVAGGINVKWKKAQKNAKKNITSDVINSNIPSLSPVCTFLVWCPFFDSRKILINQFNVVKYKPRKLIWIKSARGNIGKSISCK